MNVGGLPVVKQATELMALSISRSGPVVPLSGATHAVAHDHRFLYLSILRTALIDLAVTMLQDFGLIPKGRRRTAVNWMTEPYKDLPDLSFAEAPHGRANKVFQAWRVRTWSTVAEPTIGPNYCTSETPWAMLLRHNVLVQPLVAVLRKPQDQAWSPAIEAKLSPTQVDLIERDVAGIVSSIGRGKTSTYGGRLWVAGELAAFGQFEVVRCATVISGHGGI